MPNPILRRRILSAGQGFVPTNLPSLAGWWKSDAGVTQSGGFATQWDDQSGNGRNLTSIATAYPAYSSSSGPNGLPGLTLDGVNDYMTAAFTLAQPITIYMLLKEVSWVTAMRLFDGDADVPGGGGSNTMFIRQSFGGAGSPEIELFGGIAAVAQNNNLAIGAWGVLSAVFSGASSSIRINDTTATTGSGGTGTPTGFCLGSQVGACVNHIAAEIAVFSVAHAVGSTERQQMHDYLKRRGGL